MNSPYLNWVINNTKLNEYQLNYPYNKLDLVCIGKNLYKSTIDNNTNHPVNSPYWIKLI